MDSCHGGVGQLVHIRS